MNRPRRDLDDDIEHLFNADDALAIRERRAAEREQSLHVGEQLAEQDRILQEKAKAARDKLAAGEVEREYRRMGLEPHDRGDGVFVSLALLLNLGWRIEETDRGRVLVAPPALQKPEQREELGR